MDGIIIIIIIIIIITITIIIIIIIIIILLWLLLLLLLLLLSSSLLLRQSNVKLKKNILKDWASCYTRSSCIHICALLWSSYGFCKRCSMGPGPAMGEKAKMSEAVKADVNSPQKSNYWYPQ